MLQAQLPHYLKKNRTGRKKVFSMSLNFKKHIRKKSENPTYILA